MDSFNDRMYMEAFSRGGFEKYIGDFIGYKYWEDGRFISYANILSDCDVEIELLDVRSGSYEVLGCIRGDHCLSKNDIFNGMDQIVTDRIHLYL